MFPGSISIDEIFQAPDCLIHVHISSLVRSMLLNRPDDSVMRWFILVVALLLDPAAVLLLLVRRGAKVEHGGGPVGSTAARTTVT
jgi:hypothetical protein